MNFRANRRCCGKGFTLVEALVSITIMAIASAVLLLGISTSVDTADDAIEQTIAMGMARQLLDEVTGARYEEYGCSPYDTYLGPGGDELASGTRELFDDVGDYNAVSSQPPVDRWGVPLGTDDGRGGVRHSAFQAPVGAFADWRQEVEVAYVSGSDLTTPLPSGQTSDYRLVIVRIVAGDPEGPARVLAELRRVVAYVPPMP